MDINIKVNKATRDAIPDKNKIGVEGENLQEKLVFYFEDEFVDGIARLEYEQDGVKNYIPLTKIDQTYVVPIKNVITKPWKLNLELVITEPQQTEGIPLFKSDIFEVYITNAINAVNEAPEGYDLWIDIANAKLLLMDEKIDDANDAIENISTAIQETENLDLDVNKIEKETTVEITKKDGTTKSVKIYDGVSLQFMWQGTSLGIKTDDMEEYIFVNLQGIQGVPGPQGEPFRIKKTYSSVAEMYADFDNMNVGDYVMIATSVEIEDNAKLYTKGDLQWIFITDFSGAMGIKGETGATPIIHIGTVTSGDEPSVTISGTAENPIFNFVLKPGPQGQTGATGETGATGNGIASIIKTGTDGLVDTYTITFTNGNTTTFDVTNGENGEVTQTQLDETNAEVERAMMVYNALPKVEDEGTEITLDGTANCSMKLKLNPSELTQETTTGINMLNPDGASITKSGITFTNNGDGTFTINGTATVNVSIPLTASSVGEELTGGQEYTLAMDIISNGGSDGSLTGAINKSTTTQYNFYSIAPLQDTGIKVQATAPSEDATLREINYYIGSGGIVNNLKIRAYLVKGSYTASNVPDYEPYTGGIPSPNPDYPSEVQVIKGNNSIKIENKNLFNINATPYQVGGNTTYSVNGNILNVKGEWFIAYAINVKENTNYYISADREVISGSNAGKIAIYNATMKTQISGALLTNYSFNSGSNTKINVVLYAGYGTNGEANFSSIQLKERSSTASDYVPHQEQVLPLNLPVENLFDKDNANILNASIVATNDVYKINVSNNAKSIYISCKPNTTYTISKVLSQRFWVGTSNELPTTSTYLLNGSQNNSATSITITTPSNGNYLVVYYYLSGTDTLTEQEIRNSLQIEEDTKANQYTPYGTTPIEYCKMGTYGDEFEHDGDKWYINKNVGKKTFIGEENEDWRQAQVSSTGLYRYTLEKLDMANLYETKALLCNTFTTANSYTEIGSSTTPIMGIYSTKRIAVAVPDITTVENWKSWLSTHNTTVYYPLDTPTHTEITDSTLISQLNAIENAVSYDEQTNISQTNTGLPFRIKASAVRSLANIFDLINE